MPEDVLRQIGTIARSLDSISNVEFKQIDLAKGQYLYLVRIAEHPGIIQERLSELLCVDKTTATRALQKLVQNDLIRKEADPTNKKIRHLYVTDKGRQLYPLIKRENDFSTQIALNGLSEPERAELSRLLAQVSQNVAANWLSVKKGRQRHY
ncbi:MarR family winged helix-turn-helix transcriptional regulator [Lactobacillus selangorensis]|nr:MarR family transcriptional regulator [Lactobacillus selangorensis]KRN32759.1 MarR family transcriptional regulator [Lactobacillus selangorensis]